MPDEQNITILIQDVLDRLKSLDTKIDSITSQLVGWDKCAAFRNAYDAQLRSMNTKVDRCLSICNAYEGERSHLVDGEKLATTAEAVRAASDVQDQEIIKRLESLEGDMKFIRGAVDWSWKGIKSSAPKLVAIAVGGLLVFNTTVGRTGNFYDLYEQYGIATVFWIIANTVLLIGLVCAVLWAYFKRDKLKGLFHL